MCIIVTGSVVRRLNILEISSKLVCLFFQLTSPGKGKPKEVKQCFGVKIGIGC